MRTASPTLRRCVLWLLLAALLPLLTACGEAPDEEQLRAVVSAHLTETFGDDTFALSRLRRLGSAPMAAAGDGSPRRIVYYNVVLTFERDFDFSSWDTLNIAAFANLLGATEQGIEGLEQNGNRAGDEVRVRGSVTFSRKDGQWAPVSSVRPAVAAGVDGVGAGAGGLDSSRRTIERISGLLAEKAGDARARKEIIDEELGDAYRAIRLRLDRLDRALIIAGGPSDGEYTQIATILADTLARHGTPSNAVTSSGSTDNIGLLRGGKADVVMVQNNVAAHAQLGTGPFETDGPFYELQALASLFPEPIHVIVAADANIDGVAQLRGKRVEIGRPQSGARHTTIALLEAAGLALKDLQAIQETGLEKGLELLGMGEIDAVIATIGAPAASLQRAAADGSIRLVALTGAERDAMVARGRVYVPMVMPPSTYPGQRSAVPTVAVTALLASRRGLPSTDVDRVLTTLFDDIDFVSAGSAAGSLIARSSARAGLSIPLHPAALAFFGGDPPKGDQANDQIGDQIGDPTGIGPQGQAAPAPGAGEAEEGPAGNEQ